MNMPRNRPSGFTLIELLVVFAILGLLTALLLPALARAKRKAEGIQCVGNLRQLGIGLQVFLADNHAYPLFENPGFSKGSYAAAFSSVWQEATVTPAMRNGQFVVR